MPRLHVDFNDLDEQGCVRVFRREAPGLAIGDDVVLYDADGNTAQGTVLGWSGRDDVLAVAQMRAGSWRDGYQGKVSS